jgi:peptide/nickel transport system substrate-binding protein
MQEIAPKSAREQRSRAFVVGIGVILASGFVFAAVGASSAFAKGAGASAATPTNTLVISRTTDPQSLDPAAEVTVDGGLETFVASYERLFNLTPQGKIIPGLATKWSVSPNGKVYTITLRKGVTFHDGSPFNAAAVRYTWQRIKALNSAAVQYWSDVKNVVPVGTDTVQFDLKTVSPIFLANMAGERGVYMGPSESCVKAHATAKDPWAATYFTTHECGTGPYELTSWQHNQQLVFNAYQQYWGGWKGHHVTQIIEKIVPSPSTTALMLQQGQLDLAADTLPTSVSLELKKNSNINVVESPGTTIDQITFNMSKPPTNNVLVRRALALLFNYKAAIQLGYNGYATRAYAAIPSTVWPALPSSAPRFDTNVTEAKKLLAEAGYPHGMTLEFSVENLNQWKELALVLQQSAAQAGVNIKTNFSTWPVLFAQLQKPKGSKPFQLAGYEMFAAIPNPSDILMWWRQSADTVINPGWGTATTDGWINTAMATLSQSKQAALYQKVLKQLNTDVPGIWVDQPDNLTVMGSDVHGYQYVPYYSGLVNFYGIWKS